MLWHGEEVDLHARHDLGDPLTGLLFGDLAGAYLRAQPRLEHFVEVCGFVRMHHALGLVRVLPVGEQQLFVSRGEQREPEHTRDRRAEQPFLDVVNLQRDLRVEVIGDLRNLPQLAVHDVVVDTFEE